MKQDIRILLADDEDDIRETLKLFLSSKGFKVDTAFDGLECLDKVKADKPDLIFLDIMMPVLDGIEICHKIKNSPDCKNIKVIMLTAATSEDIEIRAKSAGADDFVSKPFDFNDILNLINKYFKD